MAQLGARLDGIEEVVGSNPIGSTNYFRILQFRAERLPPPGTQFAMFAEFPNAGASGL